METFQVPTLETERLWMRPFRSSDVDDYATMNADPEVMRYLGAAWDRGRSWRHLAFLIGHWQLGRSGMWALEDKATGAFLGMVGFAEPEGWPGFELAGILARRWWGQGYATEAARSALGYAFNVLKKDLVISLVHPENHASIRVVERVGGRVPRRIDHFGKEMLCYEIDRERYKALTLPPEERAAAPKTSGETPEASEPRRVCQALQRISPRT